MSEKTYTAFVRIDVQAHSEHEARTRIENALELDGLAWNYDPSLDIGSPRVNVPRSARPQRPRHVHGSTP